jgi:hypothetical protein
MTVEEILKRIAAFDERNEASRKFMRTIASYQAGNCSPSMVSGWIANLFPYLKGQLRTTFPAEGSNEEFYVHELDDKLTSEVTVIFTYGPTKETFPVKIVAQLNLEESVRGDLNLLRPSIEHGIRIEEHEFRVYAREA